VIPSESTPGPRGTTGSVSDGPSPEAIQRLNRVLLCILDLDSSPTIQEIRARLSEPMGRRDIDSALRRLRGAQQIEPVPDCHPTRWRVTGHGRRIADGLIQMGGGY
jgi:hypothetical protein